MEGAQLAKKKSREVHEEHENHERWLVSYADFITLLFAFFVVMYSISRVDVKRMLEAAHSIKWALAFSGTGGVSTPPLFEGPPSEGGCAVALANGQHSSTPQEKMALEKLRKKIEKKLRNVLIDKHQEFVITDIEGRRLTVRMAASNFFDTGLAALRPEALPVLDAIAGEVVPIGRNIRIEGHTDIGVVRSPRYRNNWDLSAARAATVVTYLEQAHRVEPKRLSAVGRGSTKPIATNDTLEGRETNRRIEIVVEMEKPDDPLNEAAR